MTALTPLRGSLLAIVLAATPLAASANPFTDPRNPGPVHWKDGTTIKVYIPPGPHFDDLKAGVLAWNGDPSLQAKGVSVSVEQGQAPADPANPAQPKPGTVSLKVTPGNPPAGDDSGTGGPRYGLTPGGNLAVSGTINVYEGELDTPSFSKKLATHEMGHVLGLKDSTAPDSVMQHDIADDGKGISPSDSAELVATYLATANDSKIDLHPSVIPLGDLWRYDYRAIWQEGAALAVFQIAIGNADISSVIAPDGWRRDDFTVSSDVDIATIGAGGKKLLGFMLDDEVSYLGPAAPILNFSFVSNRRPGTVAAFLNGPLPPLGPVPEPGAWSLMLLGFGLAGWQVRAAQQRRRFRIGDCAAPA